MKIGLSAQHFCLWEAIRWKSNSAQVLPVMLGGHSGLDPPLPISNRAVKRTSADDSMLFACESRSLPSYWYGELTQVVGLPDKTPAMQIAGVFVWGKPVGLSHSVASPDWLSSILGKAMRLMMAGLRWKRKHTLNLWHLRVRELF